MAKDKKPRNIKKRLLVGLSAILIIFCIALAGIGNFLVDYAIGRSGDGGNREVALEVTGTATDASLSESERNAAEQKQLTHEFISAVPANDISVTSEDGLILVGSYFAQPDSHDWALVVHGYRGSRAGMMGYAQRYYAAGYNVVAPDLRSCGQSQGSFVGMGWPDRLDMLRWIDWIVQTDPEANIVMHGVSMGGATVMMTAGEATPDNVFAFVEDCGYTSVWDIFASELNLRFHLPEHPVMDSANLIAASKAGYDFANASSVKQVAKCEKPMLFIHGVDDDFVPFPMLQVLYDAKKNGVKDKLEVEGAGHGKSSTTLGQRYWDYVFNFIDSQRA